jgi:hypothetical protein
VNVRNRAILLRRQWVCAIFLAMSMGQAAIAAELSELHWMVGSWRGSLGPQTVEEVWSEPSGGTMSTMIRLTSATETLMVELVVIREQVGSLVLHLRQFDPSLHLVVAQDMTLAALTTESVAFAGAQDAVIKLLTYRNVNPERMDVDVTTADGTVVTAVLQRR